MKKSINFECQIGLVAIITLINQAKKWKNEMGLLIWPNLYLQRAEARRLSVHFAVVPSQICDLPNSIHRLGAE